MSARPSPFDESLAWRLRVLRSSTIATSWHPSEYQGASGTSVRPFIPIVGFWETELPLRRSQASRHPLKVRSWPCRDPKYPSGISFSFQCAAPLLSTDPSLKGSRDRARRLSVNDTARLRPYTLLSLWSRSTVRTPFQVIPTHRNLHIESSSSHLYTARMCLGALRSGLREPHCPKPTSSQTNQSEHYLNHRHLQREIQVVRAPLRASLHSCLPLHHRSMVYSV